MNNYTHLNPKIYQIFIDLDNDKTMIYPYTKYCFIIKKNNYSIPRNKVELKK